MVVARDRVMTVFVFSQEIPHLTDVDRALQGRQHGLHGLTSWALSWTPLQTPDHLPVNATYEDGDTPLVQDRVKTFLISVGIKY